MEGSVVAKTQEKDRIEQSKKSAKAEQELKGEQDIERRKDVVIMMKRGKERKCEKKGEKEKREKSLGTLEKQK